MSYLDFKKFNFSDIKKKVYNQFSETITWLEEKFYVVRFIVSLKKKTDESLFFFSLFILWGFFSVTVSRGIGIWYFNWWAHLNAYFFSTAVYLFISILIIFKRYLQSRGHFQVFEENQSKLRLYENYISQKYKVELNIAFSRSGKLLLLSGFLFYNLFFYFSNPVFLWILLVLSFNLLLYFINSIYLWWFFFKTPIPEALLLQPPKPVSLFFTKVLKREYSTASNFWTTGRKNFIPLVGAVGAAIAAGVTADTAIAAHTGETTYLQRMDDRYSRGWVAVDPKTRSKMALLQSSGEDPTRYFNNGEFVLDRRRVNLGYDQYKKAGFPKNFRAELDND